MRETDLYEPVKSYFSGLGYVVNSEVKGCDVAAVKEGELVVAELKLFFNFTLLRQALERQRLADKVYLAVPRPKRFGKQSKAMEEIARRMGFGLMFVALDSPLKSVDVAVEPPGVGAASWRKNSKKRKAALREAEERTGDYNQGGSAGRKLNTAYREKSIRIACALLKAGPLPARRLMELGCGESSYGIMRNNYYGWFERQEKKGVFGLSDAGRAFLEESGDSEPVRGHMRLIEEALAKEEGGPKEEAARKG
jgi:hypothetical protein